MAKAMATEIFADGQKKSRGLPGRLECPENEPDDSDL